MSSRGVFVDDVTCGNCGKCEVVDDPDEGRMICASCGMSMGAGEMISQLPRGDTLQECLGGVHWAAYSEDEVSTPFREKEDPLHILIANGNTDIALLTPCMRIKIRDRWRAFATANLGALDGRQLGAHHAAFAIWACVEAEDAVALANVLASCKRVKHGDAYRRAIREIRARGCTEYPSDREILMPLVTLWINQIARRPAGRDLLTAHVEDVIRVVKPSRTDPRNLAAALVWDAYDATRARMTDAALVATGIYVKLTQERFAGVCGCKTATFANASGKLYRLYSSLNKPA